MLTRTMKKITKIAGAAGTELRDRSRSVQLKLLEIARAARAKGGQSQEKLKSAYSKLLHATSRVVGQAKRFAEEIAAGVKQSRFLLKQMALEGLREELETMVPLVKQVTKQTRARIFRGDTRTPGKILSLFEPSTELIRKGKAAKPNEFGKMVKLQEAENQIVVDYVVYAQRPNDADLLIPAIETHRAKLGRTPYLVAADAGFYSAKNEATAKAKGVKRVCIPNRSTKSKERRREQKKRWFRNGQKWRTGCEGRISVVKRRHGLNRCRYRGEVGMQRWVGLGVIADNLVNIGRAMQKQFTRQIRSNRIQCCEDNCLVGFNFAQCCPKLSNTVQSRPKDTSRTPWPAISAPASSKPPQPAAGCRWSRSPFSSPSAPELRWAIAATGPPALG